VLTSWELEETKNFQITFHQLILEKYIIGNFCRKRWQARPEKKLLER
jgi:hypothetical protein